MQNIPSSSVNTEIMELPRIEAGVPRTNTNGSASGRSQQRSVESVRLENRLADRESGFRDALPATEQSLFSSWVAQPLNSLRNRASQTFQVSRRCLKLVRSICSAAYCRDPNAIQHVLAQGGATGKIAQALAANPEAIGRIVRGADQSEVERLGREIISSLSQYRAGAVHPDDVISRLSDKTACDAQHIRTLGRGTICQIDHVRINGQDYAVKSLSPALSEAIKNDTYILSHIIFPSMEWLGGMSKTDVDTLNLSCKAFRDESDLNREFIYTQRQAAIFNTLTADNQYSLTVTVTSGAGAKKARKTGTAQQQVSINFKVPEVYADFSSDRALVMELIEGCSLDRQEKVLSMLKSWKPAWNNHQSLNEGQIAQILTDLEKKIPAAYLDAARRFHFLNADFHTGNVMLKLEGEALTVYFIDHGNCIKVKAFTSIPTKGLCYFWIRSLCDFFHNRIQVSQVSSGEKDEGEPAVNSADLVVSDVSSSQSVETKEAVRLGDLISVPLTYRAFKEWGQDTQRVMKVLGWCSYPEGRLVTSSFQECSVADICERLHQWVMTDWDKRSASPDAIISKDSFVNALSVLLYQAALEKNYGKWSDGERMLYVSIKFDNYIRSLGFDCLENEHMLMRVVNQVNTWKIGGLEDWRPEPR